MPHASICTPGDLRNLSLEDLRVVAEEIRQQILSACLRNGGHLGASLGAVEIAIALHAVFESPDEPIVWDVGHQAYAHKLLTGRWGQFHTIRTPGGLSGFLSRAESPHDVFGAGHSSTSLSAALAMAWARADSARWTVAVIGDGGLTAGLAFEALNNLRETKTGPLLVVLNDNAMSISQNVGALPDARSYFELFGFDYVGPIDGHDLHLLTGTLAGIRGSWNGRPIVLHVITQKGKGYAPAEEQPTSFHGIGPVQKPESSGQAKPPSRSFSAAFGDALCALAEKDPRILAITAAMAEGTGLQEFSQRFPDRFFDVGIAEGHAVTFAAGLSTQGFRPVVAIYSTFLQRALDSIIHDVALQNLPVTFAVDRAGVVGADGPTHHGAFDLVYLSMIPGMRVFAPATLSDLDQVLGEATGSAGPCAIRYPRGSGPEKSSSPLRDGVRWTGQLDSPELVGIGVGPAIHALREAAISLEAEGRRIAVVELVQVKPVPESLLHFLEKNSGAALLTAEHGVIRGGVGEHLVSLTGASGRRFSVAGYQDHFIPHGKPDALEAAEGLSVSGLVARMMELLR